jgi:hypothetical protein
MGSILIVIGTLMIAAGIGGLVRLTLRHRAEGPGKNPGEGPQPD